MNTANDTTDDIEASKIIRGLWRDEMPGRNVPEPSAASLVSDEDWRAMTNEEKWRYLP